LTEVRTTVTAQAEVHLEAEPLAEGQAVLQVVCDELCEFAAG
jgi:hypothetical protein